MWTNEGPSLYLTADRSQVVSEGDPRAAFLLCASGSQISLDEAERWGLTGDAGSKAKAEPPPNKAKAEPPPNKTKG